MQGILLLFRLCVPFCYENEKSHQKGAFWLPHKGELLFFNVHLYFHAQSVYFDDLFTESFILGLGYVVMNAHVMNWNELILIEWKLMKKSLQIAKAQK